MAFPIPKGPGTLVEWSAWNPEGYNEPNPHQQCPVCDPRRHRMPPICKFMDIFGTCRRKRTVYVTAPSTCWAPFMRFNFSAKDETTGLEAGRDYRPSGKVLPMGWSSSVGIVQQASREVLLSAGLPHQLELRKGITLPPWFTKAVIQHSSCR